MFEYIFYTEMNVFLSLNYMSIGLAFDIYILCYIMPFTIYPSGFSCNALMDR